MEKLRKTRKPPIACFSLVEYNKNVIDKKEIMKRYQSDVDIRKKESMDQSDLKKSSQKEFGDKGLKAEDVKISDFENQNSNFFP